MTIEEGVKQWFGHEGFRPGQRETVEAVLSGKDAVVVMPTGSGKSLCYQLAAMMLPGVTDRVRVEHPEPKKEADDVLERVDSRPVDEDVKKLLRRYVEIQVQSNRLEWERLSLRDRLSAKMKAEGSRYRVVELDGEKLQIRCLPKVVYSYDEALLRKRLGERYEAILEPETKRMKAFWPEVLRLLQPVMRKVGVPSRARIREEIEAGRLDRAAFAGAFTRREDVTFAVTHPAAYDA